METLDTIKVRLLARMAGPNGNHPEGAIVDVPKDKAKVLVDGRYAEYVECPPEPKPAKPAKPVMEKATSKVAEKKETATRVNTKGK